MKFWPNRSSNYAGMASYKLSNQAKEDLIRIHKYGVRTFGEEQADRYLFDFLSSLRSFPAILTDTRKLIISVKDIESKRPALTLSFTGLLNMGSKLSAFCTSA